MLDPECIFCKIGAGEIQADVVSSVEHAVAIRDLNPQAPTHVLVLPKDHIRALAELPNGGDRTVAELVDRAAEVAATEDLQDGWRLVANVGPAGGRTVDHLHLHLLGGRPMGVPAR